MSFHRAQIPRLATHFIHAIMLGQPINISKVIFDIMATYRELTRLGNLPFALVILHIMVEIRFDIQHEL